MTLKLTRRQFIQRTALKASVETERVANLPNRIIGLECLNEGPFFRRS